MARSKLAIVMVFALLLLSACNCKVKAYNFYLEGFTPVLASYRNLCDGPPALNPPGSVASIAELYSSVHTIANGECTESCAAKCRATTAAAKTAARHFDMYFRHLHSCQSHYVNMIDAHATIADRVANEACDDRQHKMGILLKMIDLLRGTELKLNPLTGSFELTVGGSSSDSSGGGLESASRAAQATSPERQLILARDGIIHDSSKIQDTAIDLVGSLTALKNKSVALISCQGENEQIPLSPR